MSIINSNSSNFIFTFPKGFFNPTIEAKYLPYIKRQPDLIWDDVTGLMNSQVQSISMPSLSMTPVEQVRKGGKMQSYKSARPVPDYFSNEMTVTMRCLNGYINYWIFLENLLMHLDLVDEDGLYFEDLYIRMLNQEGYIVQTVRFQKPTITNLSEISLSYSDNNPSFKTFDCTFRYNALELIVEND